MPTMNPDIERIISQVIEAEGGYVNNPNDRGGATKFGITEAVARTNGYSGKMQDLPLSLAQSIYRQRYVIKPGFDQVAALNTRIAAELVDTGVNMGPARAGEFLQRWLNGFNTSGSGYQDLFVDGSIGPVSIAALKAFLKWRGNAGADVLLKALNSIQGARYLEIAENNKSQRAFLFGWVANRVELSA